MQGRRPPPTERPPASPVVVTLRCRTRHSFHSLPSPGTRWPLIAEGGRWVGGCGFCDTGGLSASAARTARGERSRALGNERYSKGRACRAIGSHDISDSVALPPLSLQVSALRCCDGCFLEVRIGRSLGALRGRMSGDVSVPHSPAGKWPSVVATARHVDRPPWHGSCVAQHARARAWRGPLVSAPSDLAEGDRAALRSQPSRCPWLMPASA